MVSAALDVHKSVLQAASLDEESGEIVDRRLPASPQALAVWVDSFEGRLARVALEATSGWRWIARELSARGIEVLLVDAGEAASARGKRRKPKTDRLDARLLLSLLAAGTLPLAWLPPEEIQALRDQTRLRKALAEDVNAWASRLHALLLQEGWPCERGRLLTPSGMRWVRGLVLPPVARAYVERCLVVLGALSEELDDLERELARFAHRDERCRALMRLFGIGPVIACHLVAEIGSIRRFERPRRLVRASGLDPTVADSGEQKRRGKISKAGSPHLRWALTQAAQYARLPGSPDHERFLRVAARRGHGPATLTVARTIAKRVFHTLHALEREAA